MFSVWAGLLGWGWLSDRIGCLGGALFLLPLWVLAMLSGSEMPLWRRAFFVRHYLRPGGRLAWWLRRHLWLWTWQGAKALVLSLILLVSALAFDPIQWLVLWADVLLLGLLLALLDWVLEAELQPVWAAVLMRHWAHRINSLLLWLALVGIAYFTPQADYRGMDWAEALELGVLEVRVGCDALAVLARIGAASETMRWWAAQNLFGDLGDPQTLLLAWVLFVAAFGASFLIAWSYSRALIGVMARPLGRSDPDPDDGPSRPL